MRGTNGRRRRKLLLIISMTVGMQVSKLILVGYVYVFTRLLRRAAVVRGVVPCDRLP